MGLVPKFLQSDIEKELQKRMKRIEDAIVRRLQFLGEKCLIEMRTNKTYQDQTGNLTSSMGYVIVANGSLIDTHGFNQSVVSMSGGAGTAHGAAGGSIGEALAKEVAARFKSGFVLIVVAGMTYAAHVEARGYNVLTSAELLAEKELPKMLKALSRNIEKMN